MIKRAGESNKPGARDVCGAGAGEKFGFYQGEFEGGRNGLIAQN